jgi:hypothetical protein
MLPAAHFSRPLAVVLGLLLPTAGCGAAVPPEMKFAKSVNNPEIASNAPEIPTSTEPVPLPDVIDLVRDRPSTEDRHGNRYLITHYGKNRLCFYSSQFKDGTERYASKQKSFELLIADDDAQLLEGGGPPPIAGEIKVLGDLPNVQSKGARLYLCYESSQPLLTAKTKWVVLRGVTTGGEKKTWDDTRVFFRLVDVEAQQKEDAANAPPGQVVRKRKF